jgi:hypothetical protein
MAAAVIIAAACYAIGYSSSVLRAPSWLKRIEITNFVTAYVFLALVVALFSPITDPARLMVTNQVARLKSGVVRPEAFDFVALKFDGAGWGAAALTELGQIKDIPDATTINSRAQRALALTSRWGAIQPATPDDIAARVTVYPAGRTLPASFYDLDTGPTAGNRRPLCFHTGGSKCIARFITMRPGEAEAVILLDSVSGYLFEQDAAGHWSETAQLLGAVTCGPVRDGVEKGEFNLAPHPWPDLVFGDHRLIVVSPEYQSCASRPK